MQNEHCFIKSFYEFVDIYIIIVITQLRYIYVFGESRHISGIIVFIKFMNAFYFQK